jgi:hypothetical protein
LREQVADYEPADATAASKALTSLVVRNCPQVEMTHNALGPRGDGPSFVASLTTRAVPHVEAAWNAPVQEGADPAAFLALRAEYPHAWQLFSALADGLENQLDTVELLCSDRVPKPFVVSSRDAYSNETGRYMTDAVDPRIAHDEWVRIGWLAEHHNLPYATTDWTRIGRSCQRLFWIVDGLLSRGIDIAVTNAYVEANKVTLRWPQIPIAGDYDQRLDDAWNSPWLSGLVGETSIPGCDFFAGQQSALLTLDRARRNLVCPCGSQRKRKRCCTVVTALTHPII